MHFLVVEDLSIMRRVIVNALKSLGYDEVSEAEGGESAIEIALKENIDFIITDWMMPKISGIDLAILIRGNEKTKDIPILMITAKDDKKDVIQAMKVRIDDYLIKPFTAKILEKKINEIVAKKSKKE